VSNRPSDSTAAETFERTYAEATESVRREVLRMREKAERFREQYRRRLADWMALRASIDQRAGGSTARGTGDSLRGEYDRIGRELAVFQSRLKRLDTAARGVELLANYLDNPDPAAGEPTLAEAETSPAAQTLRVIAAQEAERLRLAEEVHDGPAQVLTNAIFQVEYLDRVLESEPVTARAELTFLRDMLREGLDEVRGFIAELRPPPADLGLGQGIANAAAEFSNRTGMKVAVDVPGIDARLAPDAKASVLRIIQEALQNVRKHAAASEVSIGLDGDQLAIADNGRGFDVMRLASGATRNFGLQFMRQRAELMGSSLQIESRQGEGTRILVRLPGTSNSKEES
jgi:two-component system sensor histidine kinase DegS